MFKNPFSFDGRIRRMEYGLSIIVYTAFSIISSLISESGGSAGPIIMLVLLIPMLWFQLSQGAKRCHDLGKSGWWQIIPFYSLWMLFQDGEHGRNEYGPNPKNPDQGRELDVLESETLDGHLRD